MRMLPRDSRLIALAAIAIAAALLVAVSGWLVPHRPLDFVGLLIAAVLISALAPEQATADTRGTMPASFVFDFALLLLFGTGPAMLAGSAATIVKGRLRASEPSEPARRTLLNAVMVMIAVAAAGLVHRLLGGTMGHFGWPMQALPIAAAVAAYSFVAAASAQVVAPLLAKQEVARTWPATVLREISTYFIGAALAVGLA